jgi:hypothetical protein
MSMLDHQFTAITHGESGIGQATVVRQAFDVTLTEIEQRIIRAYIQLVFRPEPNAGSQSVIVTRSGATEVRMTEIPQESFAPRVPQFWLEVFSLPARTSLDGFGFFELNDVTLAAAVEFVLAAMD